MEIIFLSIGLLVSALAGWLFARLKHSAGQQIVQSALQVEQEKVKSIQSQFNELKSELETQRKKVLELSTLLSTTEADHKNLQSKLQDQKKEIENLQEKFTIQFKNLANEIFEEKGKKFADQNKINLGEILNPLKEKISDFEKKVELSNKESIDRNLLI